MSPQTFILIGRSGCGKGTQGKLLETHLRSTDRGREIFYLETGAQFREFIKGSTYTSRLSKERYETNERQPDFLAVWVWSNIFVERMTGEEHLIIDGTPRSLYEAEVFDTALTFYKRKATVIYLDVGREWAEKLLLARGRADDVNLSEIDKRMNWFEKDVRPAIEFYKNNPAYNFIHIQSERPIEEVHAEILDRVGLVG